MAEAALDQVNVSGFLRDVVYTGVETLNTGGGLVTATAVQMEAFDTIRISAANTTGAVSLRLSAAGTINLVGELGTRAVTFTGSAGNDDITTGDGADTIIGGTGDDTISGSGGNDLILQSLDRWPRHHRWRHRDWILTVSPARRRRDLPHLHPRRSARRRHDRVWRPAPRSSSHAMEPTNAAIIAELDNIEEIEINSLVVDGRQRQWHSRWRPSRRRHHHGDRRLHHHQPRLLDDPHRRLVTPATRSISPASPRPTASCSPPMAATTAISAMSGPQDVFNGVVSMTSVAVTSTMIEEPAALLSFGASDGLDALVRSSIRDQLQTDLLRNDFGLGRGHTLRTELGGLAQDGHTLNDVMFGNDLDALFSGLGRTMVETADDLAPLDVSTHASEALHAAPAFAALDVSGFGQRYVSSDYDVLPA